MNFTVKLINLFISLKNKSLAVYAAAMIEFILDQTETYARRLPIDTIHVLQDYIGSIRVLEILLNAAKNGTLGSICSILSAIEERWAMFLMEIDDTSIIIDKADEEYNKLIGQMWTDYEEGQVIKNHFYNIAIGNDKITAHDDPKEALKYFERAIKVQTTRTETETCQINVSSIYGADYAGIGWCKLLTKNINYKHDALAAFNKALDILSTDMAMLNSMQALMEQAQPTANSFNNSDLSKQRNVKTALLGSYINSIQNCVQIIRSSLRFVNMVKINSNQQLEQLYFDLEPQDADETQDESLVSESSSENFNMAATDIKTEKKFEKNAQYALIFNDLTRSHDDGVQDQAFNTIDNAFKKKEFTNSSDPGFLSKQKNKAASLLKKVIVDEAYLDDSYSRISLEFEQADLQSVRALLNPDKEFEELASDSAIAVIKKEKSYWDAIPLGKA
jgi:hypothetical protein